MSRRRRQRTNMNAMPSGKRCCRGFGGMMAVAHILLLIGIYVLTAGLLRTFRWEFVLRDPIFWGLILIFAAFCMFKKAKIMYMMHLKDKR